MLQFFGFEQFYNLVLVDVQFYLGMYDLYQEWYDLLCMLFVGLDFILFMNFFFIGFISGWYGSWGLLMSQFYQDVFYEDVFKYWVVFDNIFDCILVVVIEEFLFQFLVKVFFNLVGEWFYLFVGVLFKNIGQVAIYNSFGQCVQQGIWLVG